MHREEITPAALIAPHFVKSGERICRIVTDAAGGGLSGDSFVTGRIPDECAKHHVRQHDYLP